MATDSPASTQAIAQQPTAEQSTAEQSMAQQSMSDALARLWNRFLPDIEQRVALLEAAAAALSAGSLPDELREAAHGAAHKLAGTLGTFGLPEGTELARKAELLLANEVSPDSATELAACTADLRTLLNSK